jgi:hypothetical protein
MSECETATGRAYVSPVFSTMKIALPKLTSSHRPRKSRLSNPDKVPTHLGRRVTARFDDAELGEEEKKQNSL